ncbi:uncharacterized protein PHACADRAFT_255881 [Phanerochaete carnosa HHB-10118-sp]|uniref:Uncharacterized protein n=1 Tax=Phanerochaete carnosa (strain HHB-10118-sp) TaxID=650164 RepID=K5WXZ0_PHACS|nr:uncharacterized protein PHACADRAFT_255881 [Phanerochaete carnosa HHB-10118-sp]EKM55332.1 hypothetical protein PHACADRAFT_255881 [Phanerochaete carnosa HHB-10118-sp]
MRTAIPRGQAQCYYTLDSFSAAVSLFLHVWSYDLGLTYLRYMNVSVVWWYL